MEVTDHAVTTVANRLAELTRRYARYSHNAAGLGGVLGGALVLITYFVGALVVPLGTGLRLALATSPLVWIAAKELLRAGYYQRFRRATQAWRQGERNWHLAFTLFTMVVSVVIVVSSVLSARTDPSTLTTPEAAGYLVLVAAMPVLVWFFMRTPLEFIAGVFLVAQAALVLGGGNYGLGSQLQAPIAGVALVLVGAREHRQFIALRRELVRLQRSAA